MKNNTMSTVDQEAGKDMELWCALNQYMLNKYLTLKLILISKMVKTVCPLISFNFIGALQCRQFAYKYKRVFAEMHQEISAHC